MLEGRPRLALPTVTRVAAVAALAVVASAVAESATPGTVAAQTPGGEVAGTVVEAETGRPVVDASVVLEPQGPSAPDAASPEPLTTRTDARGRYVFAAVRPGWYRLDVSRIGYRAASLWIELPSSWRIRRSLGLEVEPVELSALEVAVDHGTSAWAPGVVTGGRVSPATTAFGVAGERPTLDARALTPGDVQRMATLGEPDILRALQRLPGASGRGDYSAGVWTRGAPWGMTQLLLDGLPLYHPLHFGGAASGLSAEGLQAVLFLPGVRTAALSEGAAGVVNLVTRRADADGSVSAGLSPLALRAHAEDRWLDDRLGVSVTGRRSWWDIVNPPHVFTRGTMSGDIDYWFADLFGRVDLRLGERAMVEAGGLWEQDRVDGDIQDLVGSSEGRWGNQLGWVALAGARGNVRGRLTVGRSLHATHTRSKAWASFYTRDGRPTLDPLDVHVARALLRLEVGGVHESWLDWSAGLDRARETLDQFGADAIDRLAPGVLAEARVGWTRLWGQGTARVGPARLSAGLSWDTPAEGDAPGLGVLPDATLRVEPLDGLTLEAAAGMSRQFTYPFARAGRSFGPALGVGHVWMMAGEGRPPLTADVRTVSAEWRVAHGFGTTVTAWRRSVEGLSMNGVSAVVEGALVPVFEEGSEGRERARGVELVLWRREGRFRGELGYSRGQAKIVAPGGTWWASPADRKHSLDVTVSAVLAPGLTAGGGFRSESGWPYSDGPWQCDDAPMGEAPTCDLSDRPDEYSVNRAPGYESLDLLLDWAHPGDAWSWGVSLSLRNALGRDNLEAFRASGCPGQELISVACEGPIGPGEFGPGLTGPTPAVAVRVRF